MRTTGLTDRQRQAIEHLEAARSAGVALSAYARAQGLGVREIYDVLAALRRKGVLPRGAAGAKHSKSRFMAVRVTPSVPARSAMICHVSLGGAAVIECGEWPPAAWLAALLSGRADAAP